MNRELSAMARAILVGAAFSTPSLAAPTVTPGPILVVSPSVPCQAPAGAECLPLSITGSGFGSQTSGASLVVWDATQGFAPITIPANDTNVRVWNDHRIVVLIPSSLPYPRGFVSTPSAGSSGHFLPERWTYESFSALAGGSSNPKPNFIATDGFSNGWLSQEFATELKWWSLLTGAVARIAIPLCGDNCFRTATSTPPDATTKTSDTSEDVALGDGKVWLTQGGRWSLDVAATPVGNHSRIVSYQPNPFVPTSGTFRIYNVPGDRNTVFPVRWDPVHRRVWFSERPRPGIRPYSRIVTFDPAGIHGRPGQPANNFNFTGAARACLAGFCSMNAPSQACQTTHDCVLADQICPAGVDFLTEDSNCFHAYDIPGSAFVFGLLVGPSGNDVWFADWFHGPPGPYLGRLDAETGAVTRYPVRRVQPIVDGLYRLSPAANGDILLVRLLVNGIGRFDTSRADDPVCQTLVSPDPGVDCTNTPDATCTNPCIREIVPIPGFEGATDPKQVQIQEISEDPGGNLWFTQFSWAPENDSLDATVGFWKADRSGVALFPPLELYPEASSCNPDPGFQAAGLSTPENGDVWFAEFCRNRLGRLRRLH